ncbi:hypothetical protein [Chitinophaga sancti]|uniref:Uncharacterized protein n=1 Tax=Chitinophaga sancti TaxID=1004 RepID=A0A1K1S5N1_9BACT|nr:hypothetical protein [Chitinophaga sancti]WQD62251.1 hypothetical protein U0033_30635 [Chitinophaga sancti]WQG92180.1 hypothetical protein SR876_11750 [Chitinophaga sancti]SFW79736.1 hypothetical protein SAMN05661012_04819 [Chitinophaga sancti]
MQIKSSNKFIDLYLFTIGFATIFLLIATHMHKFIWLTLFPVFGIVLWLVVLKHRFPKAVSAKGDTMTVKYFQAFRTKYDSFPVSACRFNLEMFTRVVKDKKEKNYQLTISINNSERWKFTTMEGFHVEDFLALLKYIGIY